MNKTLKILVCASLGWTIAQIWPDQAAAKVEPAFSINPVDESHLDYMLYAATDSTFYQLMQQASLVAGQQVQQGFASDEKINSISIAILCDRQGQIAPILQGHLNRQDWNKSPDIHNWTYELTVARYLLGFESSTPTASPATRSSQPSPPNSLFQPNEDRRGSGPNYRDD